MPEKIEDSTILQGIRDYPQTPAEIAVLIGDISPNTVKSRLLMMIRNGDHNISGRTVAGRWVFWRR